MKTLTIFDAYIKTVEDLSKENHLPHKRSLRQARNFQSALRRRIEAGDQAREALKIAHHAYYSSDDDSLAFILRVANSNVAASRRLPR